MAASIGYSLRELLVNADVVLFKKYVILDSYVCNNTLVLFRCPVCPFSVVHYKKKWPFVL